MCGITGYISFHEDPQKVLTQMTASLVHRGPDDQGIWLDYREGVGLGHRRLSILDLSAHGHQPMMSHNERYLIAFNGEIYNFSSLKKELQNEGTTVHWRGTSDTEVVLETITHWGLEKALSRFIGMFAFSLWDRKNRILHLARDRVGEKPLYYGRVGKSFLFGSELKAMRRHPDWEGEVDRNSLALFLRYGNVPAPHSIYKNIRKLLPGTFLSIPPDWKTKSDFVPQPYWSAREKIAEAISSPLLLSENETISRLDMLLRQAVGQQMIADVPLGAFLSGGVDSSAIVALMQAQNTRPVKTFTIGFLDARYDEAQNAKAIARHLGTDHTEHYVSSEEALSVIPLIPSLYDEPFADSSQIPTYLVAKLARSQVTVCLSGDGGDEIFVGYNRHLYGQKVWRTSQKYPKVIRHLGASFFSKFSPACWEKIFERLGPLLPNSLRLRNPGDKIQKLTALLKTASPEAFYLSLLSQWPDPNQLLPDAKEPLIPATDPQEWLYFSELTQYMRYLDLINYLPNDILTKVDRASMGVSLESRIPYLDHRIVEFAWKIPLTQHLHHTQGKQLLRGVLDRYVPRSLIERPKMGFALPLDSWLRENPLRDWAESLLEAQSLSLYFNPQPILKKWKEHLEGSHNWQHQLWTILMFQAWRHANP